MTDPPTFDPATSQVYIAAWPDNQAKVMLMGWLFHHGVPPEQITGYAMRDYPRALNWIIKHKALPSGAEWIVLCDKDLLPDARTEPWLTAPGHLVGAEYPVHNNKAYADPSLIHSGFLRVWSGVFRQLPPPWFEVKRSADGTEIEQCLCEVFRRKVIKAGFAVTRAGFADHALKGS